MKNTIKILTGIMFLLTLNVHAKTQAIIMGTPDKPCTMHISGKFDMAGFTDRVKNEHGMGLKSLGGNLGFSHLHNHDFEYGINIFGGWATSMMHKLFSHDGKYDGFKAGVNLSARYMPKVSENFRFGGLIGIGYSRLFGEGDKNMHEAFTFGDMNFEVGPSFMHAAHTMFSWGLGLTYGMTDMRFGGEKAGKSAKQYSNLHTVRMPIYFVFHANDNVGVTLALEPGWRDLGGKHEFSHGIFYDVALGVNIGL